VTVGSAANAPHHVRRHLPAAASRRPPCPPSAGRRSRAAAHGEIVRAVGALHAARSIAAVRPARITRAAAAGSRGSRKLPASRFPVPPGTSPSGMPLFTRRRRSPWPCRRPVADEGIKALGPRFAAKRSRVARPSGASTSTVQPPRRSVSRTVRRACLGARRRRVGDQQCARPWSVALLPEEVETDRDVAPGAKLSPAVADGSSMKARCIRPGKHLVRARRRSVRPSSGEALLTHWLAHC